MTLIFTLYSWLSMDYPVRPFLFLSFIFMVSYIRISIGEMNGSRMYVFNTLRVWDLLVLLPLDHLYYDWDLCVNCAFLFFSSFLASPISLFFPFPLFALFIVLRLFLLFSFMIWTPYHLTFAFE